jgi:hypothetical protein
MSKFNLLFENSNLKLAPDRTIAGNTGEKCAKACINEATFDCETFEYCWQTGNCRLSRASVTKSDVVASADNSCDVFQRMFVSCFQLLFGSFLIRGRSKGDALYHYQKNPVEMAVSKLSEKLPAVASPSECARLCDKFAKFPCRGFSYCASTMTCYLGKTHWSDDTAITKDSNLICPHYRSMIIVRVLRNRWINPFIFGKRIVSEGLQV